VRRGGLWAKHMRLKRGAIGNTHGEHIGNLIELEGNQGKMKRIPPPPQDKKKKTIKLLCTKSTV